MQPEPLLHGGGQERALRSGTLSVPGIVGFGRAAALSTAALREEAARILTLRERFLDLLRAGIPAPQLNGHPEKRLPGTLNVSFTGVDVGDLLGALPDVAASAGSACASLDSKPSRVLSAMGLFAGGTSAAVRFSLGRFTTREEVERAAALIVRAVEELTEFRLSEPGRA